MYVPYQHAVAQHAVGDQLAQSREAAERYRQVKAAYEARRQRAQARREARARRHDRYVRVA